LPNLQAHSGGGTYYSAYTGAQSLNYINVIDNGSGSTALYAAGDMTIARLTGGTSGNATLTMSGSVVFTVTGTDTLSAMFRRDIHLLDGATLSMAGSGATIGAGNAFTLHSGSEWVIDNTLDANNIQRRIDTTSLALNLRGGA